MNEDQYIMRINVLKAECQGELRVRFQRKVQLEDETQDNEIKLHWERGRLAGLDQAEQTIAEIKRGMELESKRRSGPPLYSPDIPGVTPGGNAQVQGFAPEGMVFDATMVAQNRPVQSL